LTRSSSDSQANAPIAARLAHPAVMAARWQQMNAMSVSPQTWPIIILIILKTFVEGPPYAKME